MYTFRVYPLYFGEGEPVQRQLDALMPHRVCGGFTPGFPVHEIPVFLLLEGAVGVSDLFGAAEDRINTPADVHARHVSFYRIFGAPYGTGSPFTLKECRAQFIKVETAVKIIIAIKFVLYIEHRFVPEVLLNPGVEKCTLPRRRRWLHRYRTHQATQNRLFILRQSNEGGCRHMLGFRRNRWGNGALCQGKKQIDLMLPILNLLSFRFGRVGKFIELVKA